MLVDTTHQDIIHDIAFNLNGNRFATASSDQTMRVYTKIDDKWEKTGECKCHDGPVWKIRWADPKFGQIIATCSHDKGVSVWEEKKFIQESQNGQKQIITQWRNRIIIIESKEPVADIQFESKSNNILLAIAYVDGKLQIHKAHDQSQFIKEGDEITVLPYGLRSISWNHAPLEREMLVVAGNAIEHRYISKNKYETQQNNKTMSIWMLHYETQKFGLLKIYDFEEENTITDVQWANQNGKSFHLIASASAEGAKIWQIKITGDQTIEKLKVYYLGKEQKPNFKAFRVSFNLLSNLLAVSCECEKIDESQQKINSREVRVFQNQNGNWVPRSIIQETNFMKEVQSLQNINFYQQ